MPGGRRRSESVSGCTSPRRGDHDPVHLDPLDELLEDRLPPPRLGERRMQVRLEVVPRVDAEDAALPARVGRLEHGRHADVSTASTHRGCRAPPRSAVAARRLRRGAPHPDLVRHQMGGLRADPRQAERLRHRCDDRHGAIGRHGERAVDPVRSATSMHRVDVREVDRLGDVRHRRGRAPRDCGRRRRPGARAPSRAGSRAAGGVRRRRRGRSSCRAMLLGPRSRNATRFQRAIPHPSRRLKRAQMLRPFSRAADERLLRPAVDLRARRARWRRLEERPPAAGTRAGAHCRRRPGCSGRPSRAGLRPAASPERRT